MTENEKSNKLQQYLESIQQRITDFVLYMRAMSILRFADRVSSKKKRPDTEYVMEIARKGAKKIVEATPIILATLEPDEEYSPDFKSVYFDWVKKEPDGTRLTLRIGPRHREWMNQFPRHFFVTYDATDQAVRVSNLIHQPDVNDRVITIEIAVFNEVLFKYDRDNVADLELIGNYLQKVAQELQNGKKPSR